MKLLFSPILAGFITLLFFSSESSAEGVPRTYGELAKQSNSWQILENANGTRQAMIYADDLETLFGAICLSGRVGWFLKADWVNPYAPGATRAVDHSPHFIFTVAIKLGGRFDILDNDADGILIDGTSDFFIFMNSNGSVQLPDRYVSAVRSGSALVLSVVDADFDGSSEAASKRTIKAENFTLRGSTAALKYVSQGCR